MNKPLAELEETYSYQQHVDSGSLYPGIDYKTLPDITQPCFAVEDGTVRNYYGKDGLLYSVLTGITGEWFYVHLSGFIHPDGAQLKAGDNVGYCGESGNTEGPHLHLGLRINGVYVDPGLYLDYNEDMEETNKILKEINKTLIALQDSVQKYRMLEVSKELVDPELYVFKEVEIETGVVKSDQLVGTRYRTKDGDWSEWDMSGASYGNVRTYEVNKILYQECIGTSGDRYIRKSEDGMKWSKWELSV